MLPSSVMLLSFPAPETIDGAFVGSEFAPAGGLARPKFFLVEYVTQSLKAALFENRGA